MAPLAVAMPAIMMGTAILSAGVGVYSAIESSNQSQMQMRAQAQQAAFQASQQVMQAQQMTLQSKQSEVQAEQTLMQAQMAQLSARSEAADMLTEQHRLHAKQLVQAASSGYTLDSASFMGIVAATASKAEQDRIQVLRNGQLNAAAIKVGAESILSQAEAQKFSATSAMANAANLNKEASVYKQSANASKYSWIAPAGQALLAGAKGFTAGAEKAGWFDKPKNPEVQQA